MNCSSGVGEVTESERSCVPTRAAKRMFGPQGKRKLGPPPPILQIMILQLSPPRCVISKESVQQKWIDELWFRKQILLVYFLNFIDIDLISIRFWCESYLWPYIDNVLRVQCFGLFRNYIPGKPSSEDHSLFRFSNNISINIYFSSIISPLVFHWRDKFCLYI